jgi:hypothetical protein
MLLVPTAGITLSYEKLKKNQKIPTKIPTKKQLNHLL